MACRASGTDCAKGMSKRRNGRPAASAPMTAPKPAVAAGSGVVEGIGVKDATPGRIPTGIDVRAATDDSVMS